MTANPDKPKTPRRTANDSQLIWFFPFLLLLALALLGTAIYRTLLRSQPSLLLLPGIAASFGVTALWTLTAVLRSTLHSAADSTVRKLAALNDRVEELGIMLTLISEQQLLSDRTKSIAFREKERDTLRNAIQEDIAKQDFDAAIVLADDIEKSFGYRAEAQQLRQNIEAKRDEIVRGQVDDGVAVIDRFCRGEQWPQAFREAERLIQLFPNEDRVRRLPADIEGRRQQFKQQLVQRWRESISRKDKDVDGSIELLRQLDLYLTPAEAESIQDDARSVLKEKLVTLRKQFSDAVQSRNWSAAIKAGEIIVRDFPNTRLGGEIRDMMDVLHQRASGLEPVRA
jgi:hypothetical protein